LSDITPHLGLPVLASAQAQKHVTHNEALHLLDTLVQLAVLDRDLNAPPLSPAQGQRWIVKPSPSPTGAWAGHGNQIAAWQDGAWLFSTPRPGWIAFVEDEAVLLMWSGSAWTDLSAAIASLQNLALLGVGTTADVSNPLAAKLNNVLLTAKYDVEGGDGSLRIKVNKEDAADTASFLFQRTFSGRAEFGLTGDDDFHLKVSADGAVWRDAMTVSRTTGAARFHRGISAGLVLPECQIVIDAMSVTPPLRRQRLMSELISELIYAGVWSRLDCFYVLAAHDAQAARLNWIAPGTNNLTAQSAPTFTFDRGYAGNGSSAYLTTSYQPDGSRHYKQDDASAGVWVQTLADGNFSLGTQSNGVSVQIVSKNASGNFQSRLNDSTNSPVAEAAGTGLFAVSRSASGSYVKFKNGAVVDTPAVASTGLPVNNITLLRLASTYSANRLSAVWVGGGLTDAQQAAMFNALSAYLGDPTVGAVV